MLVIFMLYKCLLSPMYPLPSDKLEGSSVANSVIDKLFVECFYGVFVLVS